MTFSLDTMLNGFIQLPRPARLLLGVLGFTSLMGLLRAGGISWKVIVVLIIGAVIIVGLILLYILILKILKKKKADPFEQQIKEAGSAVPQSVSDASDRARMDEMRKKFEKGVTTFREKGKDLYSLPWFVIIGEPGSGKTEAIRHCGIGFPPGLQDELQGTGGTINMDWWFTNEAVILDTAGRLTFGESQGTDTSEWVEFLRLLKKTRPNCPINGLIVTIPIDSLVKDDAAEIERKGGRIARQLDRIQTNLGVRFPVFLVVTKADMLTGFRQFFADLRDPQLQHQMLGWSNPAEIDKPFDPATVDKHLQEVQERLTRRRFTKLLDSSDHGEQNVQSRTDAVDELYAFPKALDLISDRLRRYLELIFVGGEWASKPLFLRGIYFTSSMQHGEALDTELAEALGVAVESLHEAAWPDDRAYFLRDVFKDKVFKERGLVTNAANARQRQRKRRMLIIGAGTAASLAAAGLIAWGVIGYRGTLDPQVRFWTDSRGRYLNELENQNRPGLNPDNHRWQIVRRKNAEGGGVTGPYEWTQPDDREYGTTEFGTFFPIAKTRSLEPINVPAAFKPVAMLKREGVINLFDDERLAANRALYEEAIVQPLLGAARYHLNTEPDWSDENTIIGLAHQIDVLITRSNPSPRALRIDVSHPMPMRRFEVSPLLELALSDTEEVDWNVAEQEAASLQEIADWLYTSGEGNEPWPSAEVAELVDETQIQQQLNSFNTAAESRLSGTSGKLEKLRLLQLALERYATIEEELLSLKNYQGQASDLQVSDWTERYESLEAARAELQTSLSEFEGNSLASAWEAAQQEIIGEVERDYDMLLAAAVQEPAGTVSIREFDLNQLNQNSPSTPSIDPPGDEDESPADPPMPVFANADDAAIARSLIDGWSGILASAESEESQSTIARLAALDRLFLESTDGSDTSRRFESRFAMYQRADELLTPLERGSDWQFGQTADGLSQITVAIDEAQSELSILARTAGWPGSNADADESLTPVESRATDARTVTHDLIAGHLVGTLRQRNIADAFLQRISRFADINALGNEIEAQASRLTDRFPIELPDIAFSKLADQRQQGSIPALGRFHPTPAAGLFQDWRETHRILANEPNLNMSSQQALVEDYAQQYVDYWTVDGSQNLIGQLRINKDLQWSGFKIALREADQAAITNSIIEFASDVHDHALSSLLEASSGSGSAGSGATSSPALSTALIEDVRDRKRELADAKVAMTDTFERVFQSWQKLHPDALRARTRLLDDLGQVRTGVKYLYPPKSTAPLDELAETFWRQFSFDALDLLVAQVEADAVGDFDEIKQKYAAFPLGPYDSGRSLTAEEVEMARGKIESLTGAEAIADDGAAASGSMEIDQLIARLRSPVADSQMDLVRDMAAMIAVLPEQGDSNKAKILLLPHAPNSGTPVGGVWHYLGVKQGDRSPVLRNMNSSSPIDFGVLRYPGNMIAFDFKKASIDEPADAALRIMSSQGGPIQPTFDGPWGALQLLAIAQSVKPGDENGTWIVALDVLDKAEGASTSYAMRLQLEFADRPIPQEVIDLWRGN